MPCLPHESVRHSHDQGLGMAFTAQRYFPGNDQVLTIHRLTPIVMTMVTVSKSALKARMLEYFRQVEQTGEELIVTSDGLPVLKVVPFTPKQSVDTAFADVRGQLSWTGDLDEPTRAEWSDV